MIPTFDGIHHLKLPVTDLARSLTWYQSRLGYRRQLDFVEDGTLMGIAMRHPDGGPDLALRLDPDRCRAAAGFDYFSIAVPNREHLEALADHLAELGEEHAGVHAATIGWILPLLHDPDGHEIRFYTTEQHRELADDEVTVVHDVRKTAERLKLEQERVEKAQTEPIG
jgi:catechol 2,3-dioxygenase-like lactoylglutathione lyase family enzyme